MWLKLTYLDDTVLYVNMDMIETFSLDKESGGTHIAAINCAYLVKETVEEIYKKIALVSKQPVQSEWK